jgi:hypothetical protein
MVDIGVGWGCGWVCHCVLLLRESTGRTEGLLKSGMGRWKGYPASTRMISKGHVTTYLEHLTLFDSTLDYLGLGLTEIDPEYP